MCMIVAAIVLSKDHYYTYCVDGLIINTGSDETLMSIGSSTECVHDQRINQPHYHHDDECG